jgi:transposase
MPYVNTDCMQIFLDEVSARHSKDSIMIIMDGDGWHKSNELKVPSNMRIVFLLPYSPEFNPVEHLWVVLFCPIFNLHFYHTWAIKVTMYNLHPIH